MSSNAVISSRSFFVPFSEGFYYVKPAGTRMA